MAEHGDLGVYAIRCRSRCRPSGYESTFSLRIPAPSCLFRTTWGDTRFARNGVFRSCLVVECRFLVMTAGHDLPGQIQGRRQGVGDGPEFADLRCNSSTRWGGSLVTSSSVWCILVIAGGGVTPFGLYHDARLLISKREDR